MAMFTPPPKPFPTSLAYHRILSPAASVKVSPLCLGGISIGSSWGSVFGANEDPFTLLDAYYELGGNFIDTSNTYNSEDSERLIGEWMEKRGVRDEMVVVTKYTAGYKAYLNREDLDGGEGEGEKEGGRVLQSNYTGNSAKSLHISLRDSLKKLRTDYVDVLLVHWWDFGTSVEEVMIHLHAAVMAKQVLYIGVSNTPAWVVVKANEFARRNGLTPFSVYQGKWNATFRDMEAEIVPICEDQGMGILTWASLGGGSILDEEQREEQKKEKAGARKVRALSVDQVKICEVMEKLATEKETSIQAIALAYLSSQTTFVTPIVGIQTIEHIKAMPSYLSISLKPSEARKIQNAAKYDPGYPMNFLYNYRGGQEYHLGLGVGHSQQYQMAAWVNGPPKRGPYRNVLPGDDEE